MGCKGVSHMQIHKGDAQNLQSELEDTCDEFLRYRLRINNIENPLWIRL
jgi:hypothetical protein